MKGAEDSPTKEVEPLIFLHLWKQKIENYGILSLQKNGKFMRQPYQDSHFYTNKTP